MTINGMPVQHLLTDSQDVQRTIMWQLRFAVIGMEKKRKQGAVMPEKISNKYVHRTKEIQNEILSAVFV